MKRRAIYYDTETTGVRPDKDRIIEIAAFDPERNLTFSEFVNPEMPIPEESTKITGITDEMVANAKTFKEVGAAFFEFCNPSECILIAHNNDAFDKHFLIHESKRASLIPPNYNYIDTLKWSRKYRPDLPRHSLQYLREVYNVEANNAHRALDDVLVLYKIFSLMTDDLSAEKIFELTYQAPDIIRQMPFGKHRGIPLDQLPKFYLKWLAGSGALDKPENTALKESLEKLCLL